MKAIRVTDFGGPDLLKLQDVPDPKPDSGQVLIRVKAVGVNPVDTYIRSGAYARKPNLPYTPGTDAAGIVEAVGSGVKHFKTGDRVYTNGTITGAYLFQRKFLLRKEQRWECLTGRRIVRCSKWDAQRQVRFCSFMARAAASGLRACNSPAPWE